MNRTVYFSDTFDSRTNCLTFIRLVLAILVILSHCYELGNFGREPLKEFSNGQAAFGTLALAGFFAISGYLVTRSYLYLPSVWRYLWHRMLRILPAFWVCLVVVALVIGPMVYVAEHGDFNYFESLKDNPLHYVQANFLLKLHQRNIAKIFETNHYPKEVNGSLWTLYYEFMCYISVVFVGLIGLFKRHKTIILSALILCLFANVLERVISEGLYSVSSQLGSLRVPTLYVNFLAGSVFYFYRDKIPVNLYLFLVSIVLTLAGFKFGLHKLVSPLTIPYVLFWLAVKLPMNNMDKYGDYSYGTYLYAFPIQQTLVSLRMEKFGFLLYFLMSVLITMPLAILSWWLVERPCLKLKSFCFSFAAGASGCAEKKSK